jgi:hypothetical protein
MKLLLLAVVISVGLVGCGHLESESQRMEKSENNQKHPIIVIDGCQYITWRGSHSEVGFTHKGNCNNPEHRPVQTQPIPSVQLSNLRFDTVGYYYSPLIHQKP